MAASRPLSPRPRQRHRLGRMLRDVRAGDAHSPWNAPELAAPPTITVTSTAFADGQGIPLLHAGTGVGQNISPELAWSGLPDGTAQLLLIIDDPDAPLPRPLIHTVALIAASRTGLAEGELVVDNATLRLLPASGGHRGYAGPRPIPGHGVHHYGFALYALGREIPRSTPLKNLTTLRREVAGHVLARGRIIGLHERA